jgi:hypothetical protein
MPGHARLACPGDANADTRVRCALQGQRYPHARWQGRTFHGMSVA